MRLPFYSAIQKVVMKSLEHSLIMLSKYYLTIKCFIFKILAEQNPQKNALFELHCSVFAILFTFTFQSPTWRSRDNRIT